MEQKLTAAEINRQVKKEALISAALYLMFFLWWYFTGYGLADDKETRVLGLPLWFFLSSVVGYLLFSLAALVTVKIFFRNFYLDETEKAPEK